MKIIIITISILIFFFFILLFIFFKTNRFDTKSKNFIKKVFLKRNQLKPDNKKFEIYFNDFSGYKFLGIKIDSLEKLYIVKILSSLTVFILINFIGLLLQNNYFIISLCAAAICFFLPSEILKNYINKKMINIYTELPDFIDFLYLLINAGLSFDESIKYLIDNMQGNIYELFKIYRLKQMEGNSKTESLRYIGKISFCLEFERILKVISEAEIVGNPINNTLRDLSKEIRRDQRDHIKIRAEKLESNLVFIIFIFIFIPMIMLFILPIIPQFKLLFK
jgi:pilus assembly protein TadC